ncbi:MAG: hypothetical protein ACHQFX_09635 [Chitinophagales bacterium]
MQRPVLLVFLIAAITANGQTDTTKNYVPETWKKPGFGIRAGFGIQKHFYTELGVALQRYIYEARHGYMAYAYYTTFEWTPSSPGKEQVYGIKGGAEIVNNGGTGGIEVKYLFNSLSNDVVITPKFGFGIGLLTLFYGYNFSTNKYPFPNIRQHQFSLAFNSNLIHHSRKYEKDRNHK